MNPHHFWWPRVHFDEKISYVENSDKSFDSTTLQDRAREEPRHLEILRQMVSVQDVLQNACRQRTTVVFGNLSRYPALVSFHLDTIFGNEMEIAIRVGGKRLDELFERDEEEQRWWTALIQDYRADDGISTCDILFWIEPDFDASVERPFRARHLIVLTSHLLLRTVATSGPETLRVVAHHVGNNGPHPIPVPPLVKYVTLPEEDDEDFEASFVPDLFFGRHVEVLCERYVWGPNERVCADLRGCKSAREAYLKLLNARDAIRYSTRSSLKGWTVAIDDERLQNELFERLSEMKNILLTKHIGIPCNLSGMNLMVEQHYVNPFLDTMKKN